MDVKGQMRSVIQWEDPKEYQLFFKFTDKGDELKNASKLITLLPVKIRIEDFGPMA